MWWMHKEYVMEYPILIQASKKNNYDNVNEWEKDKYYVISPICKQCHRS